MTGDFSAEMETYPIKTKDVTSKTLDTAASALSAGSEWHLALRRVKMWSGKHDRQQKCNENTLPGRQKTYLNPISNEPRHTLDFVHCTQLWKWMNITSSNSFSPHVVKGLLKTQYDILFGVAVEINYSTSIFKWLYCDYFKITLLRKQQLVEGDEKRKWREGNHRCDLTCGVISSSMPFFFSYIVLHRMSGYVFGKWHCERLWHFLFEKKERSVSKPVT